MHFYYLYLKKTLFSVEILLCGIKINKIKDCSDWNMFLWLPGMTVCPDRSQTIPMKVTLVLKKVPGIPCLEGRWTTLTALRERTTVGPRPWMNLTAPQRGPWSGRGECHHAKPQPRPLYQSSTRAVSTEKPPAILLHLYTTKVSTLRSYGTATTDKRVTFSCQPHQTNPLE